MKVAPETLEKLVTLTEAALDERGYELLNPNPMVVDVINPRLSLQETIQRIVRREVSMAAYKQGLETEEEANDFDVPDEDPLPMSGFEFEDMVDEIAPVQDPPAEKAAAEPEVEPVKEEEEKEE